MIGLVSVSSLISIRLITKIRHFIYSLAIIQSVSSSTFRALFLTRDDFDVAKMDLAVLSFDVLDIFRALYDTEPPLVSFYSLRIKRSLAMSKNLLSETAT